MIEKQERIDKAINQREKSIAYFNSVNAAIEMYRMINTDIEAIDEDQHKVIVKWRDWFYSQWQEWYLATMPKDHWTKDIPAKAVKSEMMNDEIQEHQFKQDEQEE